MSPESSLDAFIDKFSPEIASQTRAVLSKMRAYLPGAVELVYDNYNALAIGFGSSERMADTVFSIAVFPRWVSLFFFNGVELPDPDGLLKGSGNQARHIRLTEPEVLDMPAVQTLMQEALVRAGDPIDPSLPSQIIIKSISSKQRPRRPE